MVILTFQNALLIISMRYTRIQSGALYITTTAVVLSETLKMIVALMVILWQKRSLPEYFKYLYESLIKDWRDTLKLSVPAIVYMIQNNLQYIAVSHLEAAVFQVSHPVTLHHNIYGIESIDHIFYLHVFVCVCVCVCVYKLFQFPKHTSLECPIATGLM